ncbi:MAG: hypothetical protein ACLFUJ_03770 [Phycisphaerae bacterium]
MRFLQIRQAELALAAGRLEEAHRLLGDEQVRSHRAGQELLDKLIAALADRARTHLAAGRISRALSDCVQAESLGGAQEEIADLKRRIESAAVKQNQQAGQAAEATARAQRHLHAGQVSLAENLLADTDDPHASLARKDIASRRQAAANACQKARSAMQRDDLSSACKVLSLAVELHPSADCVTELTDKLLTKISRKIQRAIAAGRLDRLEMLLDLAGPIGSGRDGLADATSLLQQCRLAARWAERSQFRRAAQALQLAAQLAPEAKWLKIAVDNARNAADAADQIQAGPIGLLDPDSPVGAETPAATPAQSPASAGAAETLPRQFVLQVDSAGSFVVARGDEVSIGPLSSSARPDVGLMADASLPTIRLTRSEGDYLLRAERPVAVNDRGMTRKVLADGDRIALSPRCVLRFRLPNAASSTAVLDVVSGRLPAAGARTIILADREILLGPGKRNHVPAPGLDGQAALVLRDGKLTCRSEQPLRVGDKLLGDKHPIALEAAVRLGPIGWVATRLG